MHADQHRAGPGDVGAERIWRGPIHSGIGEKPLLWRLGAWLVTLAVAFAAFGRFGWALGAALIALILSFPFAYTRISGGAYSEDEGPRIEKIGVLALFLYLVAWRTPVLIGDVFLTPLWNTVARLLARDRSRSGRHALAPLMRGRGAHPRTPQRRGVVVPPTGEDESTWEPDDQAGPRVGEQPQSGLGDWDLSGNRASLRGRHDRPTSRDWARRILRGHW